MEKKKCSETVFIITKGVFDYEKYFLFRHVLKPGGFMDEVFIPCLWRGTVLIRGYFFFT